VVVVVVVAIAADFNHHARGSFEDASAVVFRELRMPVDVGSRVPATVF
jgi:hypothetical protein